MLQGGRIGCLQQNGMSVLYALDGEGGVMSACGNDQHLKARFQMSDMTAGKGFPVTRLGSVRPR